MIITYSWLDQYKIIGLNTYPSWFYSAPLVWEKIMIQGIDALTGEVVLINGVYKLP